MRTLLRLAMDTERSNAAVTSGALAELVQGFIERAKPEAAYFYAHEGKRTALFVFDLKDASDIPAIAEPWFMKTGARVEFFPAMNVDDLKTGLEKAAAVRGASPEMAGV